MLPSRPLSLRSPKDLCSDPRVTKELPAPGPNDPSSLRQPKDRAPRGEEDRDLTLLHSQGSDLQSWLTPALSPASLQSSRDKIPPPARAREGRRTMQLSPGTIPRPEPPQSITPASPWTE